MSKKSKIEGGVERQQVVIKPLQERTAVFQLQGLSPYLQLRFTKKAEEKMRETQEAGQRSRSRKVRAPRDFEDDFEQATYRMDDGSYGIPAAAFRNAMISACRTIGFKMTLAKLSVFVEADGVDTKDGTPLVRISGEPESKTGPVRNANGSTDLRVRALWREWAVLLRVRFDSDQFSGEDVVNLLIRAGRQVGVGEGRPDSRNSPGIGLGLFEVKPQR